MRIPGRACWLTAAIGLAGCGDNVPPLDPTIPPVVVRTDAADAATCEHGGSVVRSGHDENVDGRLDDAEVEISTPVCNPAPATPAPPPPVAVRVDAEPVGATCAHGGSVVRSGRDDNRNGALDDDEVAASTPICLPAPDAALPVLVRLDAEPAGGNCVGGGTAVRSGADANRNGALEDGEIAATSYVCDHSLLTAMADEPAGANCLGGGIAFRIGRDRDRDGVLGAGEVEHTEYECTDVLSRAVEIRSAADAAVLADIRVITGALIIEGTALGEVALPRLELIGARLAVSGNAALTRLSLPRLAAVDGELTIAENARLATVDLPALTRVEGGVTLAVNAILEDLGGLAALARVGGDLAVRAHPRLLSASLPALTQVAGDTEISGNAALAAFSTTLVGRTGDVVIVGNTALTTVDLHAGTSGGVGISANPALVTARVARASAQAVEIASNDAMTSATLEIDRVDGDVTIDAPSLASLALRRFDGVAGQPAVITGELDILAPLTHLSSGPRGIAAGDLHLTGTALTRFADVVTSVGGEVILEDNPALATVHLAAIGGSLRLLRNVALTDFTVGNAPPPVIYGDVEIVGNHALRTVDGLKHTREILGSLILHHNDAMTRPAMDGLEHVAGDVTLVGLPSLQALDLPSLRRIEGRLGISETGLRTWRGSPAGLDSLQRVGHVTITANPVLEEIALDRLQTVSELFEVDSNPALVRLGLAALGGARGMVVTDNAALPTCAVTRLFARVSAQSEVQHGNDDAGTCN